MISITCIFYSFVKYFKGKTCLIYLGSNIFTHNKNINKGIKEEDKELFVDAINIKVNRVIVLENLS